MQAEQVQLQVESQRADALFERVEAPCLPLCLAAAIAFHQAHGDSKATVSRVDYDDALDIAAAALSRLIPIYTLRDPQQRRVALAVDLTKAHFARGATELRSDLAPALSVIKRVGLPFAFAAKSF